MLQVVYCPWALTLQHVPIVAPMASTNAAYQLCSIVLLRSWHLLALLHLCTPPAMALHRLALLVPHVFQASSITTACPTSDALQLLHVQCHSHDALATPFGLSQRQGGTPTCLPSVMPCLVSINVRCQIKLNPFMPSSLLSPHVVFEPSCLKACPSPYLVSLKTFRLHDLLVLNLAPCLNLIKAFEGGFHSTSSPSDVETTLEFSQP